MTATDKRHALRIIHYNDVYNINVAPCEPVGGAARFVTAVREAIRESPVETLVLFSGDAFSPAPLTPLTEGSEMPPILNATLIDVACIGNHELDRGLNVLNRRIAETNFPWLVSNVIDKTTDVPLADLARTHVLKRGGLTLGFMGLAGLDWVSTLNEVAPDNLKCTGFVETANDLSAQLRSADHCDVVIALTHMRQPDDLVLAEQAEDIDVVLGGHDHIMWKKYLNNRWVVKSGTDFKNFSTIDVFVDATGCVVIDEPCFHVVTSEVVPDPYFDAFVNKYIAKLGEGYFDTLAISTTELDGRFVAIRTKETGLGNLICDALCTELGATIALTNSGSYRSDTVEPAGPITRQTVDSVLPFQDETMVVQYTGQQLIAVLENSVSQYPLLDGRFLQVSGIWFSFDPRKPIGQRVVVTSVRCRGENSSVHSLRLDKLYSVATKSYVFAGKDGFPPGDPSSIISRATATLPNLVVHYLRSFPATQEIPIISPLTEGRIMCLAEDVTLQRYYEHGHAH